MRFSLVSCPALLLLSAGALCAGQINFVYPPEGASVPAVPKTFVFGNISPSTAALTINGERVQVHANGGFIAFLPVSAGDFAFNGSLDNGATAQRRLRIREAADARPSTGTLRLEFASQASDSEVSAGDYLRIAAVGTPGHEAVFSLGKLAQDEPLLESPAGSGRYYGSYRLAAGGQVKEFKPSARFKAGLFARGASATAKGTVRVLKAPLLVETSTDTVVLRNAPDGGYLMFLPKGVKLVSTGRVNGARRISLAPDMEAWVEDAKVQAAAGLPYAPGPLTETGSIKLKRTDFGSSASVALYEKVPFSAEVLPNGLRVTLYYANLHTNYVVYDSSDTLVKGVAFRQAGGNTVELDFETGPGGLWGYNVSYSTSSKALQVDLRAAPRPSLAWPRPLSGLTVVLDPGHSTYLKCDNNVRTPLQSVRYSSLPASAHCSLDGAVGPMETFEVNINLAIAQKLKKKLADLGANVQLTRSGDENVELQDRPKIARDLGGDLFISLHNNAIGDGEDPFSQPRGFSVYYSQRQSLALAAALHGAYLKSVPLPDEGLRYGDYLVVRMTWMPAALIENAYMIIPRQEEQLNTPAFQEQLALAASEGVLNYFHVQPQPKKVKK
jgi:N-acetylmuramoyl-L-alanine amidase